jgi:hypothetical protein
MKTYRCPASKRIADIMNVAAKKCKKEISLEAAASAYQPLNRTTFGRKFKRVRFFALPSTFDVLMSEQFLDCKKICHYLPA